MAKQNGSQHQQDRGTSRFVPGRDRFEESDRWQDRGDRGARSGNNDEFGDREGERTRSGSQGNRDWSRNQDGRAQGGDNDQASRYGQGGSRPQADGDPGYGGSARGEYDYGPRNHEMGRNSYEQWNAPRVRGDYQQNQPGQQGRGGAADWEPGNGGQRTGYDRGFYESAREGNTTGRFGQSSQGRGNDGQRTGNGHFGKGPKGYQRSDERIKEQLSDMLMDNDDVDASEITIEVKDGEVTLTGTVSSKQEKRAAEECIENASGVRDVINQLRVKRDNSSQSQSMGSSNDAGIPKSSQGSSTGGSGKGDHSPQR